MRENPEDLKAKWFVIQKIQKELAKNPKCNEIIYQIPLIQRKPDDPEPERQIDAFMELYNEKALEFRMKVPDEDEVPVIGLREDYLRIFQPQFDAVYEKYKREIKQLYKSEKTLSKRQDVQKREESVDPIKKKKIYDFLEIHLNQRYESFINTEGEAFFKGIADYMDFIGKEEVLIGFLSNIPLDDRVNRAINRYKANLEKTIEEIERAAQKLSIIIIAKKIKSQLLNSLIQKLNNYLHFRDLKRLRLASDYLITIVNTLKEMGFDVLEEILVVPAEEIPQYDYPFSPTIQVLPQDKEDLERFEENSIGGSLRKLVPIHDAILNRPRINWRTKLNSREMNAAVIGWGMNKIFNESLGYRDAWSNTFSKILTKDRYKAYVTRVHNYLTMKLEESIIKTNKQQKKPRGFVPIEVPPGSKWQDITIGFRDGHLARIKVGKGEAKIYDYGELGFKNQITHAPNKNWEFLQDIAKTQGEVTNEISLRYKNIKQRKFELSKALKKAFPTIKGEPFHPYKHFHAYKLKIRFDSSSYW